MVSKQTFKDLFSLNLKYLDYVREKTRITHQYVQNISHSGSDVENEIRQLLSRFLPSRFKVTHGYIIASNGQEAEPSVSPQVDVLIVDKLVPHSIFLFDDKTGMEAVPVESVVGILEVKRTLTKQSLMGNGKQTGGFEHLQNIFNSVNMRKNNSTRYLPGGIPFGNGLSGGLYSNPLLGIIGINHDSKLEDSTSTSYISNLATLSDRKGFLPPFDIIGSFDGFMYALVDKHPPHNFQVLNLREPSTTYSFGLMKEDGERSKTFILSRIIGYILAYLQNGSGQRTDIQNYFFNLNL